MKYVRDEVMQYVEEEDVKFIRMAFCDVYGNQKNISIMPGELSRAFSYGIAIDASAIPGFGGEVHSDLLLHPDPSTLSLLPWRPEHGKVVRMFCNVTYPDGTPFVSDTRAFLLRAAEAAKEAGISFTFGSEMEFYLFNRDENGAPTKIPYDNAGYMDIAPEDKGENVRREICLTLEQMGIYPESSHHEEGPGQNEIDFRYSDPLTAADNAVTFRSVVNTIAARNGLYADFSPKPLEAHPGNGMHINFAVKGASGDSMANAIAGILAHICELTAFLNPSEASYSRFGVDKAPRFVPRIRCAIHIWRSVFLYMPPWTALSKNCRSHRPATIICMPRRRRSHPPTVSCPCVWQMQKKPRRTARFYKVSCRTRSLRPTRDKNSPNTDKREREGGIWL